MARITDYNSLKTKVTEFAMRTGDTEFDDSGDTFIQLAESKLNRSLALRIMETEVPLTGVVSSASLTLPADFVEPFALNLTTFGEVTQLLPAESGSMARGLTNGVPSQWCIDGATIGLNVPCDQAHSFRFRYRKGFELSDAEPTNWLLTNHPDVYLAAALVWGGAYMRADEELNRWAVILQNAVEEIAWKEARGIALAPLQVDPALMGRPGFNIYTG